jgi:hypothetical protein
MPPEWLFWASMQSNRTASSQRSARHMEQTSFLLICTYVVQILISL